MYFFESKAKSPFKDDNDYLYAQLKQNMYEQQPLLHYAMNHLLCRSIEELHNTHPHHPETRSELEEKIPWLVWMLDSQPPDSPTENLLLQTYTYYTTGWRRSYMPLHAKVPQAWLRQVIPGMRERCSQLLHQWPADSVPADVVLEKIDTIINNTTPASGIPYEELLLAETLLQNLETAFTGNHEDTHTLLMEVLYCMNFNTNAFAAWYQQHFQHLLAQEADNDSRHSLIQQQQYALQMAPFNVRWTKPHRKTDMANPVLHTLLAPFFEHQLLLLQKAPTTGTGPKLPLGKKTVFEAAVIFRILFQQLGLEDKLPLKVLYTILCSILCFTGIPIVNPETFASYAQAKHHTTGILDNVISFFNDCRLAAEKLRRALRKQPVKQ